MLRRLNILCVRIFFCLYAEDAGIFAHDQFHDYLADTPVEDIREALLKLFETLNTPIEKRSLYLKPSLAAFPYTNGGLFAEEIEIPQFTDELKKTLLDNASLDFDWSEIVYNNFPWPAVETQNFVSLQENIEQTAQTILDARALYPDSSLADLYDEQTMPIELRKAHQDNDRAVMQAYGFDPKVYTDDKESLIVAELFKLYNQLSRQQEPEQMR